jgi:uncharacterized protein YegP (UPF0339 family)
VPGRFVIRTGRTGKFRFVLVSPKGKLIATSELYESKAACRSGIRAVQRLAAEASVDDESKAPRAGLKSAAAPVKEAAEKAKAVVARAATKASPIAVKAKEAMEGTLQKAKQVAAERKAGPAEKAEVGKPPEKPAGEQRS